MTKKIDQEKVELLTFAEMYMGMKLTDTQKKILESLYDEKIIYTHRPMGRNTMRSVVKEYYKKLLFRI